MRTSTSSMDLLRLVLAVFVQSMSSVADEFSVERSRCSSLSSYSLETAKLAMCHLQIRWAQIQVARSFCPWLSLFIRIGLAQTKLAPISYPIYVLWRRSSSHQDSPNHLVHLRTTNNKDPPSPTSIRRTINISFSLLFKMPITFTLIGLVSSLVEHDFVSVCLSCCSFDPSKQTIDLWSVVRKEQQEIRWRPLQMRYQLEFETWHYLMVFIQFI